MPSLVTLCSTLAVLLCLTMPLVLGKPLGNPDNMDKALSYLMKYDYLVSDGRAGKVRTNKELRHAIKEFQAMAGLHMTGSLDNETMGMMEAPRCGMSDFAKSSGTRRKRYTVQGTSWPKKHLTYMYSDKGPKMSITMQQVKEQMGRAFKEWQRHADLTFTETSNPNADILVRFESGYHDDGYPFDGKGGTLAHGFYPQTPLSGDVHFDDDENWKIDETQGGSDFYWTALHEIGHSLGLDHSNRKAAVMYPFILGFKKDLVLGDDDIRGIRYLYGMPNISIKTAPQPTMTKLLMPTKFRKESPCRKHFDAVFADKDLMTYFLAGKYYWTVNKAAQRRGPYYIELKWRNLPADGIDAAYHSKGITTFFKGKHCWAYNGTEYMKGPVNISTVFRGLNSSVENIDAAFVWGANGKTYLFKDDQYWRFNEVLNEIDMGYPVHINTSWSGVPSKLNSAMTWINGKTYFFKENDFWLFNNHEFRVEDVEPLKTNMYWMKCTELELNSNGMRGIPSTFIVFSALFALLNVIV